MLGVTHEDEIAVRRENLESERDQGFAQMCTVGDDLPAALLKVSLIVDRCNCADARQAVYGIGVERVFDTLQGLDQGGVAIGAAEPKAGEIARLGEGLYHQQVIEFGDQPNRGFSPEIDIGFVDDDHRFPVLLE